MGVYLNAMDPLHSYQEECNSPYFVDKSLLLKELTDRIRTSTKYVCITRPRRFGKSVMANMIASYYSRNGDAPGLFSRLKIAETPSHREHCGQYDVIFISFNELPRRCTSFLSGD